MMNNYNNTFKLTLEEINKLLSSLEKFKKETGMNLAFRPMTNEELDRMMEKSKDHTLSKKECIKENKMNNKKEEVINHPSHYNRENAMECIDEMILIFGKNIVANFCLCNAWKYRYRAGDKNGIEDLKKSDWYMQKYKELKNTLFSSNDEKAWMGYTE